jgi:hypothetical protein
MPVTKPATRLLFVYNADSGLFNLLTDVAHKLLSPGTYKCQLCALTHSPFAMRDDWRHFLSNLGVEYRFLHRDEFAAEYPALDIPLPSVLRETHEGLHVGLDAATLNACTSLASLKQLILEAVNDFSR